MIINVTRESQRKRVFGLGLSPKCQWAGLLWDKSADWLTLGKESYLGHVNLNDVDTDKPSRVYVMSRGGLTSIDMYTGRKYSSTYVDVMINTVYD